MKRFYLELGKEKRSAVERTEIPRIGETLYMEKGDLKYRVLDVIHNVDEDIRGESTLPLIVAELVEKPKT